MHFTMVNFVYLFYTIVTGFNRSKLLSVTSTIILNNLIDNDSNLSESVRILALSIASECNKLGKIIHMVHLWIHSMSSDKYFGTADMKILALI